jgi:hypothetical protein
MPLYEFKNEAYGLAVDVHLPVDQLQDEIVLRRVRVPQRVSTGLVREQTQAESVLKGYSKLEDAGKLGKSSFTPEEIKRAWEMPDTES